MAGPTGTLAYIDALRGYAVTLVIASHAFPMVSDLPWAVKRVSNLGFFGVQLFFVVSSITLARSWRRRERTARPGLRDFALRRVFRIAPAYFIAALGYSCLLPHGPVGVLRIAALLTFSNGWSPAQMPTVPEAWVGVPGGWSIEAEFAFYAIFPILVSVSRGVRASLCAMVLSLPLAWAANLAGEAIYAPLYGASATNQFLYYWLPNQLPVFLCGLAIHECLMALSPEGRWPEIGKRLGDHAGAVLGAGILLFLALGFVPWPRLPQADWGLVSSPVIAAAAFGGVTLAFALRPSRFLVNGLIVQVGQASFSAYLLHFAVIHAEQQLLPPGVFAVTGVAAIGAGTALFLLTLLVTSVLAQVTWRLIELPMIQLGSWLGTQFDDGHGARKLIRQAGRTAPASGPPQ